MGTVGYNARVGKIKSRSGPSGNAPPGYSPQRNSHPAPEGKGTRMFIRALLVAKAQGVTREWVTKMR